MNSLHPALLALCLLAHYSIGRAEASAVAVIDTQSDGNMSVESDRDVTKSLENGVTESLGSEKDVTKSLVEKDIAITLEGQQDVKESLDNGKDVTKSPENEQDVTESKEDGKVVTKSIEKDVTKLLEKRKDVTKLLENEEDVIKPLENGKDVTESLNSETDVTKSLDSEKEVTITPEKQNVDTKLNNNESNQSVQEESSPMARTGLLGAERGCPLGCGGCELAQPDVWCSIDGSSFTVRQARNGWWEVKCNNGELSCDTFPQFSLVHGESMDLQLTYCSLAVLPCVASRLGASNVSRLALQSPPDANLTSDMVKGMDLEALYLYGDDESAPLPFPRPAISLLPSLHTLTINRVQLQLSSGDLRDLSQLKSLELTNTRLKQLPGRAFEGLSGLSTLILWRNQLEELPPDVFTGIPSLRVLALEMNSLKTLEAVRGARPPLDALANLTAYNNQLEELTPLTNLTSLLMLNINDQSGPNPLVVPNRALAALPALRLVRAARARIHRLPADLLTASRALEEVDLSGNWIEDLPHGLFKDQSQLRTVQLSGNRLSSVSLEALRGARNLLTLDLSKNKLETLPANLASVLPSLQELDARNNRLVKIGAPLPAALRALRLDHNNLTFGPAHSQSYEDLFYVTPFNALRELRQLSLSHNRLSRFFDDVAVSLLHLRELDLSYNNITYLSGDQLSFLSANVTLDLRYNQVRLVHLNAPSAGHDGGGTTQRDINRRLLLEGNPLNCDCQLYQLALRLRGQTSDFAEPSFQLGNATCAEPQPVRGQPVTTLPLQAYSCALNNELNCSEDCSCLYRPLTDGIELNCSRVPTVYPTFKSIDLRLTEKPERLEFKIKGLRKVNLSGLYMDDIPDVSLPETVKFVDLTDNHLTKLPIKLLQRNLTLNLKGNKFSCGCFDANDIKIAKDLHRHIVDWELLTCDGGRELWSLNVEQLCSTWVAGAVGGTLGLLGLILAILAALLYVYSLEVKVWLHARGWWIIKEAEADKNKKYDAFVSFCHRDEQFVVQQLIPTLEKDYKICVHYRDWTPGEWIPAQIAASVDTSRRTIIVVSRNFVESLWGRLEFRAANMHALKERTSRVIVVLLDDITNHKELDAELRAYLSTNTYLKWGDPWFWDKLRYAMPHRDRDSLTRGRKARRADKKVQQTRHHLAKHLAGVLDAHLTADGVIVNNHNPKNNLELVVPKMVPKMDSFLPKNHDLVKDGMPKFDIPNLPSEVLRAGAEGVEGEGEGKGEGPKGLEDIVPRGGRTVVA